MDPTKKQRLDALKDRLDELKKHDPSHCSDRGTFTPHSIPPQVYQKIEEVEDEIKALEDDLQNE